MIVSLKLRQIPLPLVLAILSLLAASLACQVDLGGPQPPGKPIPIEPAAAEELQANWQSAIESAANTGQVTVLIDERQLTGLIADRFAASDEPLIRNPQVFLRENQVQVFGVAERAILKANVLITVTPEITEDGEVAFQIPDASLGPVPAPSALKSSLSAVLTEAFTGSIGSLATGIQISSLAIADGQMSIVGELR